MKEHEETTNHASEFKFKRMLKKIKEKLIQMLRPTPSAYNGHPSVIAKYHILLKNAKHLTTGNIIKNVKKLIKSPG